MKAKAEAGLKMLQLQLVGCVMPIQEMGPLPLRSMVDSELCCNKEQGRPTCVLLSLPPAVGEAVCLGWLLSGSPFILFSPLGSFP